MARETETSGGIGRREFVAGAAITGAVSTLAVCTPAVGSASGIQGCRVLLHDPTRCVGCGVCGLMCSLHHEGEAGPSVSRSGLVRDPFTYDFTFHVCQQCHFPQCYFACPLKDRARLIDEDTGTVCVDAQECIGCGSCVAACRFDPPRTKLHPVTRVALSCDRCLDRDEGPICVAYCTMNALSCDSGRRPRRPGGRRRHLKQQGGTESKD
jgi:Fe-S-cluster-containing dehydrogenase component